MTFITVINPFMVDISDRVIHIYKLGTSTRRNWRNHMEEVKENHWPPFSIHSWKDIPAISGRIATETEARNGDAVFCLQNTGAFHHAYKMELPQLAYLIDLDDNSKELRTIFDASA